MTKNSKKLHQSTKRHFVENFLNHLKNDEYILATAGEVRAYFNELLDEVRIFIKDKKKNINNPHYRGVKV